MSSSTRPASASPRPSGWPSRGRTTRVTSSLIAGALDDFEQQATDGSNALVDDYRADGDAASIVEVREFADESSTQLEDLGRLVPPDVRGDVVDAAAC